MTETAAHAIPRRSAALLAAALLATLATALGTIGGFAHWSRQAAPAAPAPAQVVQQAPAPQWADD